MKLWLLGLSLILGAPALAQEAPVIGFGVEPVGTGAGKAHSFDPPFPCHSYLMGSGKYGLTQLQNVALLPATGAVVTWTLVAINVATEDVTERRALERTGGQLLRRRERVLAGEFDQLRR